MLLSFFKQGLWDGLQLRHLPLHIVAVPIGPEVSTPMKELKPCSKWWKDISLALRYSRKSPYKLNNCRWTSRKIMDKKVKIYGRFVVTNKVLCIVFNGCVISACYLVLKAYLASWPSISDTPIVISKIPRSYNICTIHIPTFKTDLPMCSISCPTYTSHFPTETNKVAR